MSDYKVNLVNDEQPSIQERETKVLEDAGVNVNQDNTYKVDLTKTPENAVQEQSTDEVPVSEQSEASQEVGEQVRSSEEPTEEKEQIIELIKEEDNGQEVQVEEQKANDQEVKQQEELVQEVEKTVLPENIQKVVDFMNETGGSLEDYVRLNTDYSSVDEKTLLKEYYKQTKSHLDNEEIDFLIEDSFSFDEDLDDDRDIRRKKLAYKEEVNKARGFLNDLKGKYYDEVKSTSRLAPDQKEAVEFYNKYKREQEEQTALQQKASEIFTQKTESFFNQDFKGFEFKVGENRYRYKVNDADSVKQAQSNIVKTFEKFLDENGALGDAAGFHKALYAARNADSIANHFYEQGRADAIKNLQAESKNINMDPRKTSQGFVDSGGLKVRTISGDTSSKLRVKIKN